MNLKCGFVSANNTGCDSGFQLFVSPFVLTTHDRLDFFFSCLPSLFLRWWYCRCFCCSSCFWWCWSVGVIAFYIGGCGGGGGAWWCRFCFFVALHILTPPVLPLLFARCCTSGTRLSQSCLAGPWRRGCSGMPCLSLRYVGRVHDFCVSWFCFCFLCPWQAIDRVFFFVWLACFVRHLV